MKFGLRVAIMAFAGCLLAGQGSGEEPAMAAQWASFRGPQASGRVQSLPVPASWKEPRWKTPIPGLGHSCPVIWEDRIYVTTAVRESGEEALKIGLYGDIASVDDRSAQQWLLLCLDRRTGKTLWQRTVHSGVPKIKRHPKSSHANSTPATNGERIVCLMGAEGLFCFDREGTLLWKKELGPLDSGFFAVPGAQWGFGSSPVIHGNRVLVQCDVQTNSFIAAYDLNDGREIWKTPRNDVPTWSTPTVFQAPGGWQVVANGFREAAGYDLSTGRRIWHLSGGGDIPVPTPVLGPGLLYLTSAHGKLSPIYAIRTGARGDLTLPPGQTTNAFIAWSIPTGGNYMQTPIVVGDYLYACRDNGVVSCFEAATGNRRYQERLGTGRTGFTASPVAADDKLYFTSEEGTVYVLAAGPEFRVLGESSLGEPCMATPAVAQGELYFRTRNHLLAVGGE